MFTTFIRDTWPYLLLFAAGILLLTNGSDLPIGLQSRVSQSSEKGLFQLDGDVQKIFGVIAVVVASYKISRARSGR